MPISNYLPSSRLVQTGVCTSATRPNAPYQGQVIFETDTNRLLVWNGSVWVMPNQSTTNPTGLEFIASVSLSGSSTPISNVFSSQYKNYRVVGTVTTANQGGMSIRFRTSSGDDSTSNYRWGRAYLRFDDAVKGSYGEVNGNAATVVMMKAIEQAVCFDVFGPNTATPTTYNSMPYVEADSATTSSWLGIASGTMNTTTQYTGFTLIHTTGTFTGGSVSVYGYRS